jgi:hypothetical protein
MSQESSPPEEEMPEHEFLPGGGVRGKYYQRYREGVSIRIEVTHTPFLAASGGENNQRVRLSLDSPELIVISQISPAFAR